MKKITNSILLFFFIAFVFTSCTKDFAKYNLSPDAISSVSPGALFSDATVNTSTTDMFPRTAYCHAFMQYGYANDWPGNAYVSTDDVNSRYWNNFYRPSLNDLEYVIPVLKTRTDLQSTYAAARIWRVFIFQKLTDYYGDIPYSQAGKALTDKIFTPVYDPQQQIYADFVKELRESIALLNANSSQKVIGDQFYAGSASQWAKLGASLLLRVGMRMIKVDPTQAAALAKEAVADGVMSSNADMPILLHNAASPNGFNFTLNDGVNHFFLHKTLITQMKVSGDPRLQIYGAVYDTFVANSGSIQSTDTTKYIGYSFNAADPIPNTRVNYPVFGPLATPFFDFPYAEVAFLEAEAVVRGYISGDANAFYQAGITAHMKSLSLLPTSPTISDVQISAYLAKNPLPATSEAQIARINTEFWLTGFIFDADEVWANWRRTGYPVLKPVPNSSGSIPRKIPYPLSEFQLNSANVNAALANYGGTNDFNAKARVWWDK
ncbi:MAG: SusD/RagB family nutrient-binding outer membrane lipoprotein [Bacteroidota bacterium]|nr:SusD/RagB family nutrient-binding outer membrane lipoprotein [Bacteroidota bacterium]